MKYIKEEDYIKIMKTIPVVCVDAIIQNENKEFLLVKRLNEPLKGQFWMPGGRLLKGESAKEGVLRKVKQEIGIDCKVVKCLGCIEEIYPTTEQLKDCSFHAVSIVFLINIGNQDIKLDNQSEEWRWFKRLPKAFKKYKILNQLL